MNIHLPNDVERDILTQVQSGQFPSVDAAIAEAWRQFEQHRRTQQPSATPTSPFSALS